MRHQMIARALAAVMLVGLADTAQAMYAQDLFPEIVLPSGLTDKEKLAELKAREPIPGQWNLGLDKCKAYCAETGRPMLAVWGKWNCAHCEAFDALFFHDDWKAMMATPPWNDVVFCYLPGNETTNFPECAENGSWFNWMGGTDMSGGGNWWTTNEFPGRGYISAYPFLAFYWPEGKVDWHAFAESALADETGFPGSEVVPAKERIARMVKVFERVFAGYEGSGANFGAEELIGTDPYARLEIEVGKTAYVDVPLWRTKHLDVVATNILYAAYRSVTTGVDYVEWPIAKAGETRQEQFVRIPVPSTITAGETISLGLTTDKSKLVAESAITAVETANSPKNPHWIGEYAGSGANALPFGEWTMDLAVAQERVANYNKALAPGAKEAFVLLMLEGVLWCPDCESTEINLLNRSEFKTWARENHAALVVLDIPDANNENPTGEGSPTLLSYKGYEALGTLRSGAGYRSRHMVPTVDAEAALAQTLAYAAKDITAGGLRLPGWENAYRPAVPTLFVLREGGAIAGRLGDFGETPPTAYKAAYLKRLDEMVDALADDYEEKNGDFRSTEQAMGPRDSLSAWVSHSDSADVIRLENAAGQYVKVSLGAAKPTTANVKLSLLKTTDGELETLATASGRLSSGLAIEKNIPEGDVWIAIEASGETFAVDYANSTEAYYDLTTDNVLIPTGEVQRYDARDTESDVTIRLTSGKTYYIEGLGEFSRPEVRKQALNVYIANTSGDVTLPLLTRGGLVVYSMPDDDFFTESQISFVVGETAFSRLEAEIGFTTYVQVPLRRRANTDRPAVTMLADSLGATTNWQAVAWSAGETNTFATVRVPAAAKVGDTLKLKIFTGKLDPIATSSIACVDTVPNSPGNPRWLGERKPAELGYGEWTMDLEAAKARLGTDKSARLLLLLEGSMWCPDCVKTDANLLERAEFKRWAQENHVITVALDVPNVKAGNPTGAGYPTLLTYNEETALSETRSGAGYLSRHMVDAEVAADFLATTLDLAKKEVSEGGLRRPGWSNPARPGVPTLFVLHEDGTIAGRIAEFGVSGPAAYKGAYLKRLSELLALVGDEKEEDNDEIATSASRISPTGSLTATLSAVDKADYHQLQNGHVKLSTTLKGPASARVNFALIDPENPGAPIAETTGDILNGLKLESDVAISNAYLAVRAIVEGEGATFAFERDADCLRSYTLKTEAIFAPGGDFTTYKVPVGVSRIRLAVKAGTVYYLEGISELSGEAARVLERSDKEGEENLYYAREDAELELNLKSGCTEFNYCISESGTFGFTETVLSVTEGESGGKSQEVLFKVARHGSAFGPASVKVSVDTEVSTAEPERYVWEDAVVSWKSGEAGEKTLSFRLLDDEFFDAPIQYLVFKLESAGTGIIDIEPGAGRLTVIIIENDEEKVGSLAFTGAEPAFARTMTVFAEENSDVTFEVTRAEGVSGEVSAFLRMSGDGIEPVESERMVWENRTRIAQRDATLTLPSCAEAKKVAVTIVAEGISVVASRRSVAVYVLPSSAPRFEKQSLEINAYCNTAIDELVGLADFDPECEYEVSKVGGALPPGVSAEFDGQALRISGTPSRTGSFTAGYRVARRNGEELEEGLSLTIDVIVEKLPVEGGKEGANPYIARTRTFRNLPLIDGDRVIGMLTLTLPANGRASAKISNEKGAFAYAAKGWAGFSNGNATVELTCTRDAWSDYGSLRAVADAAGGVEITLEKTDGSRITAKAVESAWSRADSALAFAGTYNIQLPQDGGATTTLGDGYMSLRMSDAQADYGRMIFAGALPNGRAVSGTGELVRYGGNAILPFFTRSAEDVFSGVYLILPNARKQQSSGQQISNDYIGAAAETKPYWLHTAPDGVDTTGFKVYGGYYDPVNIYSECARLYGCSELGLIFAKETDKMAHSQAFGDAGPLKTMKLKVDDRSIVLDDPVNPNGVKFAFAPATGIYSGVFTLRFEGGATRSATFRGMVIPGWGGCEECGRLLPGPFGGGAFWFSDALSGQPIKSGGSIRINKKDE